MGAKSSINGVEYEADAPAVIQTAPAVDDDPLELLRELLLDHYRNRVQELEAEAAKARQQLVALETRIGDTNELMATITPVIAHSIQKSIREAPHDMIDALSPIIADAVRTSIAESREAMVEALYPITGQLVQRSVTEAMRDLARRIDAQMRTTFDLKSIWQRIRIMLGLGPSSEHLLRQALPFQVEEIFLIHRETGLLLHHLRSGLVNSAEQPQDAELIGSMLTAIRDFVNDVFGRGEEGQLTQVQHGEKLILLEAAHFSYLAIVVTGVEAQGYRASMRERIFAIDNEYMRLLRDFSGDVSPFAMTAEQLKQLFILGSG
ncbi:MAG: hypothetical protein U0175_32540 [Caldilineaceae bacterium]